MICGFYVVSKTKIMVLRKLALLFEIGGEY